MTIFHAWMPPGRVSGSTVRPVDPARLQPDARVADLRGTDQVVERHPVGLRQRQQQLQAGAPLSVLQPRQRALRDARPVRRLGQRQAPLLTHPPQPWTDQVQRRRDAPNVRRRSMTSATVARCHGPFAARVFPESATTVVGGRSQRRTLDDMNQPATPTSRHSAGPRASD